MGHRALVVEDDLTLGEVLRKKLEREGHEVVVATNQRDAYHLLDDRELDFVLLDLRLPTHEGDMDPHSQVGFDILDHIRDRFAQDELPVVVMTAYEESSQTAVRALNALANDYITKPFEDSPVSLDEKLALIGRTIEERRASTSNEPKKHSIVFTRDRRRIPFGAPVLFTICVDIHKLELIMVRRRWSLVTNDLTLLIFGIQDAALMAQNLVLAAESIGLGTCFLGAAPHAARTLRKRYKLPERVFPLVQLAVGYPAEDPPPRPRYPLKFVLFEEEYPVLSDTDIEESMLVMDEGYRAQDYYKASNAMIELSGERRETFTYDDYSWTEHIARKWGQWFAELDAVLEPLRSCGFNVAAQQKDGEEAHSG